MLPQNSTTSRSQELDRILIKKHLSDSEWYTSMTCRSTDNKTLRSPDTITDFRYNLQTNFEFSVFNFRHPYYSTVIGIDLTSLHVRSATLSCYSGPHVPRREHCCNNATVTLRVLKMSPESDEELASCLRGRVLHQSNTRQMSKA